jgi:hypothetical protein
LNALLATHSCVTKIFSTVREEPKHIKYITPESENVKEPKITDTLPAYSSVYTMLTGIIVRRNSSQLEEHSSLPAEQKGCHSGSKGCKDQLLISKTIFEDCRKRKRI